MFRLIDHNEADAILTLDTHIYNTSYVIVREKEVGAHFIAGRNSPLWDRERISPQELTQQPFLLTERGMSYRRLMEERLAGMSLEIRPCLEIGSADLICQLVSQGEALGFLPDYVTARARAAGQIRWLPVEGLEIRLWKQLLYHKDNGFPRPYRRYWTSAYSGSLRRIPPRPVSLSPALRESGARMPHPQRSPFHSHYGGGHLIGCPEGLFHVHSPVQAGHQGADMGIPAPMVSTGLTGTPGACQSSPSGVWQRAPFSPSVTITGALVRAAKNRAASPVSPQPDMAWLSE